MAVLSAPSLSSGDYSPHTKILASFMSPKIGCVCPPHSENVFGEALFLAPTDARLLHSYLFLTRTNKSLTRLIYNVAAFL